MEVDSDLLHAARKGRRDAIIELLALHYPLVWRMAEALTGRRDVARGVMKYIMPRSLKALPSWKNETDPTRWFYHHTLLTTRRTSPKHRPEPLQDSLIDGPTTTAGYLAFIKALRDLPMQQREAFILTNGERAETRAMAVAMDLSTTAAANHLREATERLQALAPDKFDAHVARLRGAYQKLSPDEELGVTGIRSNVQRLVRPWFIRRTLRTIFSIVALGAAAWGAWWVWRIVQHSIQP
jgi:DNA-directed RNA polymerase specialized sigma24 family protein